MKISFGKACELSATEFYLLRERAENPASFDLAAQQMMDEGWTCDTAKGTTRNNHGVQAHFVGYDWGAEYDAHPHFVFYDFFRGHLLNKYSRVLRGV